MKHVSQDNLTHYLYRITNTINGKIYIGQTIQPDKRWYQHRKDSANPTQIIHHAINKYGAEVFTFEVIAGSKTWEETNDTEALLIAQYNSLVPNGYNVSLGGMNAPKTEEWKRKASEAKLGSKNPMFGKPRSEEDKNKTRVAQLGELGNFYGRHHTTETKQLISEKSKGRIFTIEHRSKLSYAKQNKYNGTKNPASKLTENDLIIIRQMISDGTSSRKIAKALSVSKSTILRIKNGQSHIV